MSITNGKTYNDAEVTTYLREKTIFIEGYILAINHVYQGERKLILFDKALNRYFSKDETALNQEVLDKSALELSSGCINLDTKRNLVFYESNYKRGLYIGYIDEGSIFDVDIMNKIEGYISDYVKTWVKLDHKNELIYQALNSIQDGITICDDEGYVRFANEACLSIIDAKEEDLVGKRVCDLTDDKPLLDKVLELGKSIIDIEYDLHFANRVNHLFNSGYPIFDDNHRLVGAVDIFRSSERTKKLANAVAGHEAVFQFDDIVTNSDNMKNVIMQAKQFAMSDENFLILGESGTGKELFAQSIHNYSKRSTNIFVAVNCANLPNELMESELFGYSEGAFSGAKKGGKPGKFELANGGTLFLDEIGELPLHLQAKLLRVLENKSFTRIGSNKPINVDVRIVAATNRNLLQSVEANEFRGDLYYRLNVMSIVLPSLNERRGDIIPLAKHFIKKFQEKLNHPEIRISGEAETLMLKYPWSGNVRQLENTIYRAIYQCTGNMITADVLLSSGIGEVCKAEINTYVKTYSRDEMLKVLEANGFNKKKTAEILGISRPTLYKWIKRYNIEC